MEGTYVGGWRLQPVKEVELPYVQLTKRQLQENEKARKAHDKLCKELDAVAAKFEKLGGWMEDLGYPPLELPHDPYAYDTASFNEKQSAYYEWQQHGTKSTLIELKRLGMKLDYSPGMLMSVGSGNLYDYKPKLPDWAK